MDFLSKDHLISTGLRNLFILILIPALSACQLGYIIKSGYYQAQILSSRVDVDQVLASSSVNDETKRKLRLIEDVKKFSQSSLGLKVTKNYSSYVEWPKPYITYAVNASPKYKLEHYLWSFPLVGSVPYKGYFEQPDAREESDRLKKLGYDTYVRGVTAYSTVGWFNDPVLSTMMKYDDPDLVDLIIHESVHSTLYIKSSADFNERLAVFVANIGTKKYYESTTPKDSTAIRLIENKMSDLKTFSTFISRELENLDHWYSSKNQEEIETQRSEKLNEITKRFLSEVAPKLKTKYFQGFSSLQLNNAVLLNYKTYMQDLSDFENLFDSCGHDFNRFWKFMTLSKEAHQTC